MLSGFGTRSRILNDDELRLVGRVEQPPRTMVEQAVPRSEPTRKSGPDSCIGSDMSIVGNVECDGPAQVFGRLEGELRVSDLLVGAGAEIERSASAQHTTACGPVRGTIRAIRVKLQDGGTVAGDIFYRSLSIDESSLFEGSSRRVEKPMDTLSSVDAKGLHKKD